MMHLNVCLLFFALGVLQSVDEHLQEAVLQEQQAAQKQAAERRDRVAKVEKQRKQQTALLRKKTRTGQPIMKHRIDKLLDALQT